MPGVILCAVDDADDASVARTLGVARDLGTRLGCPLVVVHVLADAAPAAGLPAVDVPASAPGFGLPPEYRPDTLTGAGLEAEVRERIGAIARAHGVSGEVVVEQDASVPDGLRRAAAAYGAEMLVVGSHGHGAVRAALLGSTTHALAGEAPCPVLVVPAA